MSKQFIIFPLRKPKPLILFGAIFYIETQSSDNKGTGKLAKLGKVNHFMCLKICLLINLDNYFFFSPIEETA